MSIATRLLWPDSVTASPRDREAAGAIVRRSTLGGAVHPDAAQTRQRSIDEAVTRGELYDALHGLDEGVPPWGLSTALRISAVVWVLMTVVQLVVWGAVSLAHQTFESPWWIYSTVGGAAVVATLWVIDESFLSRGRLSGGRRQGGV